jgi:hypothetical protein
MHFHDVRQQEDRYVEIGISRVVHSENYLFSSLIIGRNRTKPMSLFRRDDMTVEHTRLLLHLFQPAPSNL